MQNNCDSSILEEFFMLCYAPNLSWTFIHISVLFRALEVSTLQHCFMFIVLLIALTLQPSQYAGHKSKLTKPLFNSNVHMVWGLWPMGNYFIFLRYLDSFLSWKTRIHTILCFSSQEIELVTSNLQHSHTLHNNYLC
jgi:hypothetical protein